MNLEKLEAFINNMSKDQYLKFENAVFDLLQENKLFSSTEITQIEKKILSRKQLERENILVANN